MASVVQLFPANVHLTVSELLGRVQSMLESGDIQPDDKALFLFGQTGSGNVGYVHKGMDVLNIVGMLEMAKIQIINEQTKAIS